MKLFKIILLFLIPLMGFATDGKKHEKTKTIRKVYDVNENATVFIKNKYGNINVTTWDKNTVEIDIKITVKGNNIKRVNDKLDAINVDFQTTKQLIEARTRIENTSSGWSWWGNNSNVNFKINYTVKMPMTNHVDLNNKYGNIFLDDLKGKANINCDYGSIEIGELFNNSNYIELDYCGSSEINYLKAGEINADYSKLKIDKADKVNANVDYTSFKVGDVKDLSFNIDYGSITVNNAVDITGSSDYASMRFGTITKNLKIDTDYGGLRIKNLAKGFENVTIDGSYASIKIATSSDNNFNFNINLGYASFKYPESNVELFKSIKKTSKKQYKGVFGNENNSSNVTIKSSYGGVSIKLND